PLGRVPVCPPAVFIEREKNLAIRREGELGLLYRKDAAFDARRQVADANALMIGSLQRDGFAVRAQGDVLGGDDRGLADNLARVDVDTRQGYLGLRIKPLRLPLNLCGNS